MAASDDTDRQGRLCLALACEVGISEALVATAIGLATAIPAVIAFNHFSNKLRQVESEMSNFSADFLNIVKRDLLRRQSPRPEAVSLAKGASPAV